MRAATPEPPPAPEAAAPSKKNAEPLAPSPEDEAAPSAAQLAPLDPAQAARLWQQTVAQLQGIGAAYAAEANHVAISAPNLLVVSFLKRYNSHKAFCEQPDQVQRVEQALSDVAGRPMRVAYTLSEDDGPAPAETVARPAATRDRLREKAKHPLVSRAIELFDARLVKVDERSK